MSAIKHHKVVVALPDPLEADSVYYVRAGAGFDQYVTNSTGVVASYSNNAAVLAEELLARASVKVTRTVASLADSFEVAGSANQFGISSSTPAVGDGYALLSETIATEDDELIEIVFHVPFFTISSAGNAVLALWVNNVLQTMRVERLSSGATSGQGTTLQCKLRVSGTSQTIVARIGPASSSSTLKFVTHFGAAAQPSLTITQYGVVTTAPGGGGVVPATACLRRGKTIAIAGDSVTGQNSGSSSRSRLRDIGYMTWALRWSQQRVLFDSEWNFGVGGDNTADLLVRLPSVLAVKPDYLVITIGGNDVTHPITLSESISNLDAIYDACAAAGVFVIHGLIYPRGPGATYTEAHLKKAAAINNHIREQSKIRAGLEIIDGAAPFTNYDNGDGRSQAVYLPDDIHPGVLGAGVIGYLLSRLLCELEPSRPYWATDPGDVYDAVANPGGNLLPNGTMLGSSGTVQAGATGQAPDSWAVYFSGGMEAGGALSASVATLTGATGAENTRAAAMSMTGLTGASGCTAVFQSDTSAIPVGSYVEAMCVIEVADVRTAAALQLDIRMEGSYGLVYATGGELTGASTSPHAAIFMPPAAVDGGCKWVLRTPKILVAAGTTNIKLRVGFGAFGAADVDIRFSVASASVRVVGG